MSSVLQHAPSDEQLTGAIAAGDATAFDELYRRYARPLAAYGARVLRDQSGGEDVAQVTLTRAYEALRRGTEPLRVKPWLYKIALNTALEQRAKSGEVLEWDSDRHEEVVEETSAERADILAAVQLLPERQRMVFFLREVQGLTVSEVAQRLDLDNQRVEQALFAARNRLAEELVFGARVDCNLVRSLDADALTRFERRALKGHIRSCPSCRRRSRFGLSSVAFWLRDAWHYLAGGGSISVAKAGALAVSAAALGTAPITVPVIAHKLVRPARAAQPGVALADAAPPRELQQIDRLNETFAAPFVRPLMQRFAAPPVQIPAEVPPFDPFISPPASDSGSGPQPADQSVAQSSGSLPAPAATDASATDPSTTDTSTDPSGTDPIATDTVSTDPSATDPSLADQMATDPSTTDPTATDPSATDPTATDPTVTDPTSTDPSVTDSTSTDTTTTDTTASP